jgi:hypothetical protein
MSSTPHPTIPGCTVRPHRISPSWRVTEHRGFDNTEVIADPDDMEISLSSFGEWLPVDEARLLAEMILDAAAWLAAQTGEADAS